jgi:hypothetical protein
LKYLDKKHIDPHKWNLCIEQGVFYLPYARFEYLDAISSGQWGAIVEGDYNAVFPFAYRKKWGVIPYIYQPYFCQQLGVFGNPSSSVDVFISKIPWYFARVHLNINGHFGQPEKAISLPNLVKKIPHNIDVDFNKDALKNIKKLATQNIIFTQTKDIHHVLKLYKEAWGEKAALQWPIDYLPFESACLSMLNQNLLYACLAHKGQELLGGALFLKGKKRLHYVCAAPTELGRTCGIMHGIVQHAMEHFPDYDLDFEGSQIPSVAAFYKKFGAKNESYYRIERTLWL